MIEFLPRIEANLPVSEFMEEIATVIETNSDLTLDEIRDALAARGVSVSVAAVWRFFDRHNITRKKRPRTPPSKSGPTS